MEPISLEDLALLETLQRIDRGIELTAADSELRQRLLEGALVTESADGLRLTLAGIELCQSFQHRVAADVQASRIRERRGKAGAKQGEASEAPAKS